jgi:hypothetical protein
MSECAGESVYRWRNLCLPRPSSHLERQARQLLQDGRRPDQLLALERQDGFILRRGAEGREGVLEFERRIVF